MFRRKKEPEIKIVEETEEPILGPHQPRFKSLDESRKLIRKKTRRKYYKIAAGILAVFAVAGLIWLLKFISNITDQPFNLFAKSEIQKKLDSGERMNFLLMGYGGGNHEGTYLTDTIILVSVKTNPPDGETEVTMINVPRDLWVPIPTDNGRFYSKINTAFTYGMDRQYFRNKEEEQKEKDKGMNNTKSVVEDTFGLKIEYVGSVNFDAFVKIIDNLGGVDVNVEKSFTDYSYPTETGGVQTVKFSKGPQYMDGKRALIYVRSRNSVQDGGDFGRSKRQQKVIEAVKKKANSPGIVTKIIPLANELGANVRTNLAINDIKDIIGFAAKDKPIKINNQILDNTNILEITRSADGQSILSPKGASYAALQKYIRELLSGQTTAVENPTIQVLNGTQRVGLASKLNTEIQSKGFTTLPPTNSSQQFQKTVIYDYTGGKAPQTIKSLEGLVKVKATSLQKDPNSQEDRDIIIIIGADYKSS